MGREAGMGAWGEMGNGKWERREGGEQRGGLLSQSNGEKLPKCSVGWESP